MLCSKLPVTGTSAKISPFILRSIGTLRIWRKQRALHGLTLAALSLFAVLPRGAAAEKTSDNNAEANLSADISDEALVKELPGFQNEFERVDGVRLHYVVGGSGDPLFLLPGWPETWWAYRKILVPLSRHYRVYSIDLRGMGASERPPGGYEKKQMAADVMELAKAHGYSQVNIVGHDIGSMVAFSFAANFPNLTRRLVMIDTPHPDMGLVKRGILPEIGYPGDKYVDGHSYPWWFAFNQVRGLPEKLLAGRDQLLQDWFFHYMSMDDSAIDARDHAVYLAAYNSADGIRAGDAWYQAFPQDVEDGSHYLPLRVPVLGLGGPGYGWLKATLATKAPGARVIRVEGSGHFIAEEQPAKTISYIEEFLK